MFAAMSVLQKGQKDARLSLSKSPARRGQTFDILLGVAILAIGILSANHMGLPIRYSYLTMGLGGGYALATLTSLLASKLTKKRNASMEIKEKGKKIKTVVINILKALSFLAFTLGVAGYLTKYCSFNMSTVLMSAGGGSLLVFMLIQMANICLQEKLKHDRKEVKI